MVLDARRNATTAAIKAFSESVSNAAATIDRLRNDFIS